MNPRGLRDALANEVFMNGGFTYKPDAGLIQFLPPSQKSRYLVGIGEIQSGCSYELTRENFKKSIEHARKENLFIGGWLDTEEDIIYYDYSKGFDSLEEALELARSRNEIAIWDTEENKEIRLEDVK